MIEFVAFIYFKAVFFHIEVFNIMCWMAALEADHATVRWAKVFEQIVGNYAKSKYCLLFGCISLAFNNKN